MSDMLNVLAGLPEEEAKRAWLASQDQLSAAPAWGQGGAAVTLPPPQASWQELSLQELCEEDVEAACDTISLEEEAKLAWLSKQTPSALRGFVATPPPVVAASETEVLAQGERLLQGTGLNLTAQEKEAVRMAMEIIRRQ